jgi:GNAT superfamily N-acetyltransferase
MTTLTWLRQTDDPLVRRLLSSQIPRRLYEWGDLDPVYRASARFFATPERDAVAMMFDGAEPPVVLALGDTDADARLAGALAAHLDGDRYYAHLSERCEQAALASGWRVTDRAPHVRMALPEDATLPSPGAYEVVGPESGARVLSLLERAYPAHTFHPAMLEAAPFVMLTRSGQDVACAGLHILAPTQGVAALGNIAVAPEARGEGLGVRVTAAVCQLARARGAGLVGLNVREDNLTARGCYARVGFTDANVFIEGHIERAA